ncbi:MAG TPA: M4 family metallopeptidase, partial [Kofleriaceae bacterium]|nr:M4 family metallopeptidase [Kofleriaceae bacterium]
MKQRLFAKNFICGALLAAAVSACASGTDGEAKDDPTGNSDIVEALSALPEATVLMYSADGVPQYIVGELGKIDPTQTDALVAADGRLRPALTPILKAFRLRNDHLVLRKVNTDDDGGRHFRYAQKFNGVDVIGGDLVVHVDVKGAITAVNGTARGDIAQNLGAVAISESAANAAIAGDARYAGMSVTGSRTVYVQAQDGSLHKAFEQIVEGKRGQDPVRDKVFVDVASGEIVAVQPQIFHARNRLTYTANNGTSLPGTLKRTETQAAVGDTAVDKAHDSTLDVYDAYKLFFNRDSIDNAGMNMISTVHYSTNYCNAFWNSSQMTYGDGNASQGCAPLANSLDVAGHEITHGVTERESGLTYSGESGGLNESFSDIFGAFTEAYRLGGRNGTLSMDPKVFLIGDEVLPPYLRNMCDPAADNVSRDVWSSSLGSVDVHYSSGPNNLVFCLLTKGGKHPRGKTTNNVPALGFDKTIRIFYKTNADILTSNANYAAMRTAMEQAAAALYPGDTATKDAVSCAYAAISVGSAPASCGGSPPPPPPTDGVLMNGVPQTGIADSTTGNMKFWKLDVPAGQTSLTFTISGGTGDADMYVNFGAQPSTTVYQCRPYLSGNAETCTFSPPSAGTYWVGLNAYAAYSGVTLTGTYSATGGGDPYLTNGTAVTNISGAASSAKYWRINVPSGKTLTIKTSGGTGDADLYTRFNARPTTTTYACRPYVSGNNETCTATTTASTAGDWYVGLNAYSAYSGAS